MAGAEEVTPPAKWQPSHYVNFEKCMETVGITRFHIYWIYIFFSSFTISQIHSDVSMSSRHVTITGQPGPGKTKLYMFIPFSYS